jgi:spore cortex formation protein SpoVR/YcgB (stage V sporulation)
VFGQSFGERTAVVVTDENAWAAGARVQRNLEAAGRETVEKFADSYRELMEEIEKQGCALAR